MQFHQSAHTGGVGYRCCRAQVVIDYCNIDQRLFKGIYRLHVACKNVCISQNSQTTTENPEKPRTMILMMCVGQEEAIPRILRVKAIWGEKQFSHSRNSMLCVFQHATVFHLLSKTQPYSAWYEQSELVSDFHVTAQSADEVNRRREIRR